MGEKITNSAVQIAVNDGMATIEQGTILTRLHYFDGKFLRAEALTLEQEYHRALVRLSNLAGGWGVVHGLGISVASNLLTVTPGLAMTPAGNTVLLSNAISVEVAKLIDAAAPAPASAGAATFHDCQAGAAAPTATAPGIGYYEITVGPLQGLCGNEEVFGKLCEDACVTDSQSPYWKEGMMLRLRPITLTLPASSAVPPAAVHLRNRVAAAYFGAEPWLAASLLSGAGLASSAWCNPATLYNRDEVPIGLLVQEGATTRLIDAWSARRERMATQARGYWQGRMTMRPWNVFLAQILQFQCQLPAVFTPGPAPEGDDCEEIRDLLKHSLKELRKLQEGYAASSQQILKMLKEQGLENASQYASDFAGSDAQLGKLTTALAEAQDAYPALPAKRLLINAGFLDLPPAGYLPVDPTRPTINEQLKRFFGEGVKLFFCTARPDYLPHAVEEVQHMERISLTRGLDDVAQIEDVEIFVPNGKIVDSAGTDAGVYWNLAMSELALTYIFLSLNLQGELAEANLDTTGGRKKSAKTFRSPTFAKLTAKAMAANAAAPSALNLAGIMRTTRLENGGAAQTLVYKRNDAPPLPGQEQNDRELGGYLDWRIQDDPFARQEGDQVNMQIDHRLQYRAADGKTWAESITGGGQLTIENMYPVNNQTMGIDGTVALQLKIDIFPAGVTLTAHANARVKLVRQGDARSGQVVVLPEISPTTQLHLQWTVDWLGKPRTARLRVATAQPGKSLGASAAADDSVTVAEAAELTVSLKPENPLRLAALNMLGELAGATDGTAFLTRARRNMFPDTVVTTEEMLVRASLDWVLFRRRRKAECDQRCASQVVAGTPLVSMQVWHVKLTSTKLIDVLIEALDNDNAEAATNFTFERVGVLHYAALRSNPQETVTQILVDWQDKKPGNTALLGRAWGSTAVTQGEPHLARLIRLTETLNAVTTAPPEEDMRALPAPPAAVADVQFGGGVLLATFDRQTRPQRQRVYLVERGHSDKVSAILKQNGNGIVSFLADVAAYAIDVEFVSNEPDQDTLNKVAAQFQQLAGSAGGDAIPLVSTSGADAAALAARHQSIIDALNVVTAKRVDVDEPEFGEDTPAATLVYFRQG